MLLKEQKTVILFDVVHQYVKNKFSSVIHAAPSLIKMIIGLIMKIIILMLGNACKNKLLNKFNQI